MEEKNNQKPKSDINFFAETNFRNQQRRFGIKTDDRRRHFYIIGKTGMGKTNLMEQMIIADIHDGKGVGLVDPHGDFVEKILNYIPNSRINDVIYFNPADVDYPIGFNVLETIDPRHKHLVASGLMGVFKKIWPDVWSPRMEYILNNCILALLDYPGSTLLGINRLLVDREYRKRVIAQIQNPVVKTFWVDEYARYSERFATEAIAPIQNKVGQFLSSSIIRNVVAQVKSTIDIREIMDKGKIFIMNLAKGRIGEDSSRLLGGMLITKLQLAAMERVDLPEEKRNDFYLYVDEFQNFATESFANILSEARKYHLDLILAHQYIEQLDETVRPAVFGNVGTIICFRVGAEDAEFLAKEFAPEFTEEDLVNLPKYNIYLKLMIEGVASTPFSAQTFLPDFQPTGNYEKVLRVSRERYAQPRASIEDKIMRWSGLAGGEEDDKSQIQNPPPERLASPGRADKSQINSKFQILNSNFEEQKERKPVGGGGKRYPATCSRCGKAMDVPFVPDGVRPTYCIDCYKAVMAKGNAPGLSVAKTLSRPAPPESAKTISLSEAYKTSPPPRPKAPPAVVETSRRDVPASVKLREASRLASNQPKKLTPGQIVVL